MQGLREPSFLPMKKNPAPTGEDKVRIITAKDSLMYFSLLSLSDKPERGWLCNLLEGKRVPGSKSIGQSYARWGGGERTLDLLKTWWRSWYSEGTLVRSTGESSGRGPVRGFAADWREVDKQWLLQDSILLFFQSGWGLWRMSHK